MRNLIVLYLLVNIFTFNLTFSRQIDNNFDYYSDAELNKQFPVYDNVDYSIRFYAFVDEVSCFTCIQSLKNLISYLNDEAKNTEIIIFLHSENFKLSKKVFVKENFKVKIINDKIEAYKNLYKVKNNPVCYLLDNSGKVRFIGVPGSASFFNINDFRNTISKLLKQKNKQHINDYTITKKIILKVNSNEIGNILQAFWDTDTEKFLLWDFKGKNSYQFDSTGKLINKKDFSNYKNPIFTFASKYKKEYVFSDFDFDYNLHFYRYNIISDSINKLYSINAKDNKYPLYTYLLVNDTFLVSAYWLDKSMLNKNSNSFSINNIITNKSIDAGIFDNYYYKYYLFNFYHSDFCLNNENQIAFIQNFSDSLRFYDLEGHFINSKFINYDSSFYYYNWKIVFSKLNSKTKIYKLKALADSVTNLCDAQCLLFDKITNKFFIIYQKYFVNNSNHKEYRYFVHTIPNTNKDYFLGKNKPFFVRNNILYCTKKDNDMLLINLIKLKE